jgi:tRNA/rRNA methyltransferase
MEVESQVTKINLSHIALVLHKPHFPENIGAAARAAKNMGIRRLVVSDPFKCDLTRILKMATHTAEDVVADMEVYDNLDDALSPFQYIVGTTARTGAHRQTVRSPRRLARDLIPITQNNEVAILFGPEDRGLTSKDLKYCNAFVTIPTADFKSLNLAQAVMILAYELSLASTEESKPFVPRLATSRELEGMYEHLSETLSRINFINRENPEYWMLSVRRFCSRIGLRAREVKLIRGVCRQFDWYCSHQPTQTPNPEIQQD